MTNLETPVFHLRMPNRPIEVSGEGGGAGHYEVGSLSGADAS